MHRALLTVLCLSSAAQADTVLRPKISAGPVTPRSTEARLKESLGASQVRWDPNFAMADLPPTGATVLWPNDPSRTLYVLWKDRKHRSHPDGVIVSGDHRTVWHLANGLTLGTTLAQLEKWNGRSFKMGGFDWDYGGSPDFTGGRLEHWNGVSLVLGHGALLSDKDGKAITGEKTLSSSDPVVRRSHVHVQMITVDL